MGDNVVSLSDYREDVPLMAGPARCIGCGHEWDAAAPVGTVELECAECNTRRGAFVTCAAPAEYWECNCGGDLFFASRRGCMCARCGVMQTFE